MSICPYIHQTTHLATRFPFSTDTISLNQDTGLLVMRLTYTFQVPFSRLWSMMEETKNTDPARMVTPDQMIGA